MARPQKKGLDYFSLDVDAFNDDKFFYIRSECGPLGEFVIVRLLAEIYRVGYAYKWDNKTAVIFSGKTGIPIDVCKRAVESALDVGLLQRKLHKERGLLSSKSIQERYLKVCQDSKRKEPEGGFIDPDLSLLRKKPPDDRVYSGGNSEMAGFTPEENTQRIVKNNKEKNIKQNHSGGGDEKKPDPLKYLTPELRCELEDLQKRGFDFIHSKLDPNTFRMPLKKYPDVWLNPLELSGFLNTCSRVGENELEVLKLVQNNNRGKGDATNLGRSANAVEGWALDQIMRRSSNELKNRRLIKQ